MTHKSARQYLSVSIYVHLYVQWASRHVLHRDGKSGWRNQLEASTGHCYVVFAIFSLSFHSGFLQVRENWKK